MKISFLIYLLLSIPFFLAGQSTFSLAPDTVFAKKYADEEAIHAYAQFENYSGDSLHLRWIKRSLVFTDAAGHPPGGVLSWEFDFQACGDYYADVHQKVDSADFWLAPEAASIDKMVGYLFPKGAPGRMVADFVVFPVDHPADSFRLVLDFTVLPLTATSTSAQKSPDLPQLYPNPAGSYTTVSNLPKGAERVLLLNAQGQVVQTYPVQGRADIRLSLAHLPRGRYQLLYLQERWRPLEALILR